jgi:glycosyltransferase involved in cell wall biosynthesis
MNQVLSILFIAPLPPPVTGQSVAAAVLHAKLLSAGHKVVTINLSKNTFRQGISSIGRLAEVMKLVWQTWRAGPDFDRVYFTVAESVAGNLKDLLLLAVLGSLRKKTWLHLHGGAGMRNLLGEATHWLARLNGFFLRRVAGVIVLGERLAPIYRGYLQPDRIRIVKNFAGDSSFPGAEQVAEKWRRRETIRVLFLSNLLPGKGHQELIAAVRVLPPEVAGRFHFDFAGGFESEQDQSVFVEAIKPLSNVTYHGTVAGEAKRQLLTRAHAFCLPTYYPYEGQPISILEAYASGCLVITTDHSGIFDIFQPELNGFAVEKRSSRSLCNALVRLASDLEAAESIGMRNLAVASDEYTQSIHLAHLLAAIGVPGRA